MSNDTRKAIPFGAPRGFSLIEMLAVITVIVILITLVVASGLLVIQRQERAITTGALSSLDRALEEYLVERSAFPPFIPEMYEITPGRKIVIGGADNLKERYLDRDQHRHPDASVFLRQARGIGRVNEIVANIPERLTMTTEVDADGERDTTPSVLDAWADPDSWAATASLGQDDAFPVLHPAARLIFYVHPNNRLAQDLYGRCVNGRPYFFSAGPDGLYGTTSQLSENGDRDAAFVESARIGLEDNLYSYEVGPPRDDEEFEDQWR